MTLKETFLKPELDLIESGLSAGGKASNQKKAWNIGRIPCSYDFSSNNKEKKTRNEEERANRKKKIISKDVHMVKRRNLLKYLLIFH